MDVKLIVTTCVIFLCKYADAAVTGWTTPSGTTGHDVSFAFTTKLAENHAIGVTTLTMLVAGPTGTLTYAITAQTVAGKFTVATSTLTGTISLATALDYETNTEHILTITATDSAGGNVGTATATISLTDYNDVNPSRTPTTSVANVRSGSCSATAVGTYAFTDGDATTVNQAVTYAITAGNTGTRFAIDSDGAVTVAIGMTVDVDDGSMYSLVITATNTATPALSGSATVTVYVCSAPTIAVSLLTLLVALLVSMR